MKAVLSDVSMGKHGIALPTTSLAFESGRALLAVAETEQRPSVLGLIAAGRMRPGTGEVSVSDLGSTGRARRSARWHLRDRVALVDAPDVNDPAPNATLFGVGEEERMFAGLRAGPAATLRWLRQLELGVSTRTPIGDVSPGIRVRLLLELAALRTTRDGDALDAFVLVSPDRHGGDPLEWWSLAEEFAGRGHGVLVIAGEASAAVLDGRAPRAELTRDAPDAADGSAHPPTLQTHHASDHAAEEASR